MVARAACRAFIASVLMLPISCQVAVLDVDGAGLQRTVGRSKRTVALLYDGAACLATHHFQPWLFAIAQRLPGLTFVRVDISNTTGSPGIAHSFRVDAEKPSPRIKAFMRDAETGGRVIDFTGALEFDPLLSWGTAMRDSLPHELSAPGYEPPIDEDSRQREIEERRKKNAMSNLPDNVRNMADTMVKEGRLKRALEEIGMYEAYESEVSKVFKAILSENKLSEGSEAFKTQEANRLARNLVREKILKNAPAHIKDMIDQEVTLGQGLTPGGDDGKDEL